MPVDLPPPSSEPLEPLPAADTVSVSAADSPTTPAPPSIAGPGPYRDAIDSIIFTVLLIVLFRTFVAEPFEIPTGSMGMTLLGRHKQLDCPHCGHPALISTSDEIDLETGRARLSLSSAQCPNCRQELSIANLPSLRGDRILVLKDPPASYRRFDVLVFKNVDSPRKYYVKRLVGLPGETLRINRGEVEILKPETGWQIAVKGPEQIQAMAQLVYDDRYALDASQPLRWSALPATGWIKEGSAYTTQPTDKPTLYRLAYRHWLPGHTGPSLITDAVAYNSGLSDSQAANAWLHRTGAGHPVTDLLLSMTVQTGPSTSSFGAELAAGVHRFRWRWAKESGSHEFWRNEKLIGVLPAGEPNGRFTFGHVDRHLWLWQEDRFLGGFPAGENSSDPKPPRENDLQPATVLVQGAGTRVSDLVLRRDIYYSRQSQSLDYFRPEEVTDLLSNPKSWRRLQQIRPQQDPWVLGPGQYAFLGDNSARSSDSRHWRHGPGVSEAMILGRAILVLWPLSERAGRIW